MNSAPSPMAESLFKAPAQFVLGVAALKQLPEGDRPEVAFAGRSNVGKSSLINALTGQGKLAKTSNTPGRTQQLNFFDINDGDLYLVDMPGYGYAKVSKTIKEAWNKLILDYLKGRQTLRCVFVLIDSRHGLKDNDRELMTMLDESAVNYRIVLTKTDKIKTQHLSKITADIETALKKHPAAFPTTLHTSAEKKIGLNDLKSVIYSAL